MCAHPSSAEGRRSWRRSWQWRSSVPGDPWKDVWQITRVRNHRRVALRPRGISPCQQPLVSETRRCRLLEPWFCSEAWDANRLHRLRPAATCYLLTPPHATLTTPIRLPRATERFCSAVLLIRWVYVLPALANVLIQINHQWSSLGAAVRTGFPSGERTRWRLCEGVF